MFPRFRPAGYDGSQILSVTRQVGKPNQTLGTRFIDPLQKYWYDSYGNIR